MRKVLRWVKNNYLGIIIAAVLAFVGMGLSKIIPYGLISGGVFALLIGMCFNPLINKKKVLFNDGINFTAKKLLKVAIVLMGVTLSFTQVLEVGKFSLIVMCFTLVSAFGFGYLFGKLFKMNWKLSSLISAGTGICGGSAIAAISPVIEAKDSDIAYAISATFIFDIFMVILFPIVARALHMSDLGYGLWAGTAVNDTSSVVAAGYAYSDIAGKFAVIVKLTRTLSIVPIVVIFSFINQRIKQKERRAAQAVAVDSFSNNVASVNNNAMPINSSVAPINNNAMPINSSVVSINNNVPPVNNNAMAIEGGENLKNETVIKNNTIDNTKTKIDFKKIFPFFIIFFLVVVGIKSTGILPEAFCDVVATISKFIMVMALGAIGLKTNFKAVAKSGFKPMLHGFIISTLVVFVAFGVQAMLGQL